MNIKTTKRRRKKLKRERKNMLRLIMENGAYTLDDFLNRICLVINFFGLEAFIDIRHLGYNFRKTIQEFCCGEQNRINRHTHEKKRQERKKFTETVTIYSLPQNQYTFART